MATVRTPGETLPARTYYHVIRILSLLFLVKFAQGQGPGGGRVLFDIAEGLPKGHFVGTIATQGGYTYTFNENNPYFLLDQNSGTITTSVVLDRESLPQNRIDLLIVGRQTTQSSSYPIEVTVKVIDINDNAPKFSESSISITIPENAQKGTQTLIDTATDPDEGVNGTVGNYQIIAGNEDGKFILVEPQQLSPYMYIENVQELDRETKDFYQLRVSAEDGGSPRKAGYLFINLTIQDVNDNPPIFDHSDYTASINESAASETSVIRVHATDRDKGRNADITYSISDETNQFTIDTQTGEISNLVSADQLVCHRECQRSLMSQCHARSCFITVEAHDGGKPSLSGRAYISVNLIDENDHEPNISFTHMPDRSKPYSAVDENVRSAQVVAIVSVLDADQGLNGQTTLTIIRGNEQGHFKLLRRGSFNLIQVDGRLDRERTSMYNLTLMAVDEGSPPKSSVAYLIIYVNDVNDHTPEFQKLSYSQTLSELAPVGSFVASVVATDLDSGVNAELTYSILSGDDHGWFKIDRSTGLVTTSHRLDFETTSRVILNISATDGAITPHKNFTTLTITLLDENDMSPTFSQPVINVNITEGTGASVHVATLIAEDNDGGNNGTISYYLHQSVDDKYPGTFRLVSGTARIETIKNLDREDVAHYTLYFVASDQGSPPLSSTATINLNVLDVNDNAPVFYPEEYYSRVFENQQVSTSVEQIRCTDLDEGKNGEVVYSISEGDRDSFDIDPLTGLLTTRVRLDRERRSTYRLTITAHDQGEISKSTLNSAIVHIVVGDMNDVIPVFVGTPYTFAIVEDGDGQAVQTGRRVGSVKATTEDTTGITYSLVDGDPNDVFMINSMSGKITTRNKVDREIQSFYKLMVVAAGGVMFSSAEVTITVDDLNDNFPIFASESQDYSVLENSGIGFDVCLAKALDSDDGPNAQVSYTLQSDAGNTFSIRPDTGIIFITKSLNMAVRKSYNMVVTASDAGTPRKTASMQVNIHVKDVNDHTPTFPYQNYEVSLLESQTVNDRFFVLTASDGDFGANGEIVYNITRGNDGGSFGIFPDGVLYVARPLDRETRDFYHLTVSASDRGDVPRSASMNMTVHILDDNDNRPLFLNTTYSMYVEESVSARTTIGSVSAIDKDIGRNAEISYSLATENKAFSVNLQTGEILTLESFDREKLKESTGNDFISFEVQAIDNGETRLEDRATVNVYITDVNDNAPRFSKQLYSIPLHEQAPVNSQVLKVSASDLDTGLNSYISYSLVAGDGLETFNIDAASGVIILTSRIDRETKDIYHLTVMASDNGKTNQNSATASVRISIVDDNDNFPQFVQTLLETHLLETTLPGHVITQFVASDSDIANNAAISYTITSGNVLDTFSLDFTTGKLYLDKPLDYEAKQSYALNITAEDFGSPRLSSYIRFIVNVDDYNDNPPSFPASPIMKQVTEGPFVQSPVVKVTASDPDSGINRELRYSIVNQDPPGNYFRIDSRSGMIYINSEIDREFSDQFNITVVATDQAEPPVARKSSQKSVLIIVKDRNDNAPEFVSMPAVGVSPNSPSSTQIMTISAQDADLDKNGLVRYRLVTADRSLFALDSESGLLYLSSALPAQPLVHRVTVRAEDQGVQDVLGQKNTNMEITIFVRSATANGPTFDQASFGGSVYENRPRDTFILEVSASSTTSASVKYYITKIVSGGVEQPQYFQIDENLGTLSTTKPLDREMGFSFFDVEVYAVETNGAGPKTRSVQVQIELKDENDTPPKFSQNVYNFEIPETQLVGTTVATVTVEDSDVTGEVTLSIAEGNANGMFRIDDNGRITNLKVLDRETKPSHWLKVRATDGVQESFATVNLVLLDINDHAPRFPKSSFSFDIPEDTPLSTTVASVMATDEDAGKNGHVTYLLVSDWGRDVFQLHPTRGTFTLIRQLDFEQVQHYILTVRAVDGGDPALTSDLTLYMNIVDVNDNVPVFDPMSYQGEVWENTNVGTSILTVRATDTDSEANAEIEYWIVAGDLSGDLSMGAEDGVIRTARPLDRETHATYSLTVMAVDRAVPPAHLTNKLNSTAEVIIHVRDVNDEAPVFVSSDKVWVKENSVIGEAVFTVSAVDRDDGRNADVEYTLVTQNSPFSLGRNSGKLIPQQVIDREKAGEYVLEITATDKGSKPQTATTKLQVYVEDVNDNNPVFDPRRYQKTVAEDTGVGTSLLQVTASDKDSGFNGVVRYFIIEGDDNRDFRMDHSSGTLRVQKSLDYERKNSYILVVQAEDSGVSVRYDTATVTVGITDVNDNAPVFFHSPYHAFVQENQQDLPVHAIQVSAHDEDSELNSQVTYTLRDGDRSKFDINSASGEVTVLQTLDREASSEYLLVVIATDSGTPPLTGTGTISVIVQDVNDNTPAFQHQNYFGSIEENLDKYSPVMRVKALDGDEGMNAEIRYSLVAGAEDRFTIDPATGTILTMTSLDREEREQYNLVVLATDGGFDPRSASTKVTIAVDDVNDNQPRFEQPQYTQEILDPTEPGDFVLGVTAVDRDSGPNGKIHYELYGGDSSAFHLDPHSGIITAKSRLTKSTKSVYRFQVRASDTAERPLTVQTSVTVQFSSAPPSSRPRFTSDPQTSPLKESLSVSHPVTTVQAVSARSSLINYFIAGGNVGQTFAIDPKSGAVTVAKSLDYELTSSYNLWIEARDLGSPLVSQYKPVVIDIVDENDNIPRFSQQYRNITISEDRGDRPSNLKRPVLRLTATDLDSGNNGKVRFQISSGNIENAFSMNAETGEIKTNGKIDRERVQHYSLQITAIDQGSPSLTASASVDVYVEDVNDNPPQFTRQSAVSIPENTEIGAFVLRATSTDNDIGENARVIYSLGRNPDERFRIDPDSGNITVNGLLDAELKNVYNIEVVATDLAYRPSTPVTITIQDVNDNAPVFNKSTFNFYFNEGQSNNAFVGRVNATDSDITSPNNQFYFSLERPSSIFHLDTNMGNIYSLKTLHFVPPSQGPDSSNRYELDILATDLGVPPKVSKAKVVITVGDANDHAPTFSQRRYFSAVEEMVTAQEVILNLNASDNMDYGMNAEVEYLKDGGNGSTLFDVDPTSGALSVSRSLSGLRNRDLIVTVRAQDKGIKPRSSRVDVQLRVTGINRYAPRITTTKLDGSLPEDVQPGSLITTIQATDDDAGINGEVQFSVTGGNDYQLFSIDEVSGSLTVAKPLDFDTVQTHYINITAKDRAFRSKSTTVTYVLKLSDVNDNAPVFNQSRYNAYIQENSANSTWVCRAHATDRDSGAHAVVEYSIISDTDARTMFTIESRSGIIRLFGSLDFEVRKEYTMTVLARNPGVQNLRNTTTIVVHVTGKNEFVPHFRRSSYEFRTSKSAGRGTSIGSVSASDNDDGEDGIVYYFLVGASNLQGFRIDMRTGNITVGGSLATSSALVTLTVLAKNSGSIKGNDTDTCEVRITVQAVQSQPCGDKYCQNGGECIRTGGDFVCKCPNTWSGPSCSTDVNECNDSPCKPEEVCRNTDGSFYCECAGNQGTDCGQTDDFCRKNNPCRNGGTCENEAEGYRCECGFGYWGPECQHQSFSFTDGSYLESPPLDAFQNHITLYFATVQTNALLLFNPGQSVTEFMALEILDSTVNFSYAVGGSQTATKLNVPVSVSDGRWYKVEVTRGQQTSSLKVSACPSTGGDCDLCRHGDSNCHATALAAGRFNAGGNKLTVGGVRNFEEVLKRAGKLQTFQFLGCMRSVVVEGQDILLPPYDNRAVSAVNPGCGRSSAGGRCNADSCSKRGECVDEWTTARCDCDKGYAGDSCEQEWSPVSFGADTIVSYVVRESYKRDQMLTNAIASSRRKRAADQPSLSVRFLTTAKSGVLVYTAGDQTFGSLLVKNSNVVFTYKLALGGEVDVMAGGVDVTTGEWHQAAVTLTGNKLELSVDGSVRNSSVPGLNYDLTGSDMADLSLGGAPSFVRIGGVTPAGFTGCMEEFLLDGEVLPFSGHTDRFTIEVQGDSSSTNCPAKLTTPQPADDKLSPGIIVVIVFFALVLVAIVVVFVVCRSRRALCWKAKVPDDGRAKHNGTVPKHGNDTGGNRSQDSGYSGDNNEVPEEVIIRNLVSEQMTLTHARKQNGILSGDLPRPDIIDSERRSTIPMPLEIDDGTVIIENGDLSHIPHSNEDIPEHYDLENASSIAPSDIDVVTHYKGFRDGKIHKYKTNPHVPSYHKPPPPRLPSTARSSPMSHSANGRSSALSRGSQGSLNNPPVAMLGANSPRNSPLAMNNLARSSPASQSARNTPLNHLSRPNISSSPPGYPAHSRRTTPISGVGRRTDSECSMSSASTGRHRNAPAPRSRPGSKFSDPYRQYPSKPPAFKGLTVEEVDRLNARPRGNSPVSMLDAVSSTSDDNVMFKVKGSRQAPAQPMLLEPPDSTTDESANDSFTCSEFEYDNDKVRNDFDPSMMIFSKLTEVENETDDHNPELRPFGQDGRDSRGDSYSELPSSEEERFRPQKPINGQFNWDYLLNWGPSFEKLVGVFKDIALLPDGEPASEPQNLSASGQPNTEEYV